MRPVEFQILLTLAHGDCHGYAIIQDIQARSNGALTVETGTLYRALQRLAEEDLVRPQEGRRTSPVDDDRRRVYAITTAGRRAATEEARRMSALVEQARAARLLGGA